MKSVNPKLKRVQRELARRKHIRFMQYCWAKQDPLILGLHTKLISERIDKALEDFKQGKSTFLRIKVHQRAGKSDIVSRFLPPRFLAEFPDHELMNVSYSADKAKGFARSALKIVKSRQFRELYPDTELQRSAVGNWSVMTREPNSDIYIPRAGQALSAGLSSGLTGDGYHLGILDDYCGSRRDAESPTFRNTAWDAFTDDFMSRMAPVSITIILATQWHVDDIHGRIERKNDPESEDYDPDFPKFEVLSFPANRDLAPQELAAQYPGTYLFMERYSEAWYKGQYAQLGSYSSSAMMDCNPVPREGGILFIDGIKWHETTDAFPKNIQYYRVWDYAHTAENKPGKKGDPDYTGGTLIGFQRGPRNPANNMYAWEIWILDYTQFREGATKRDQRIRHVADKDGRNVKLLIETSLDSQDGYAYIKKQLGGIFSVLPVNPRGDKVQRCTPVEPIFEAGNVHVLRGPWNQTWLRGLQMFDGSGRTHDEMVDNITAGFQYAEYRHRAPQGKGTYGRV